MISVDKGQIEQTNKSKVALIHLLDVEHNIRYLESLPYLHDKVLKADENATFTVSSNQKKNLGNVLEISW